MQPTKKNSSSSGENLRLFGSIVGGILSLLCLGLLITALIREEWISWNVTEDASLSLTTNSDRQYYSRFRGVFYECVKSADAQILKTKTYSDQVKNQRCFDLDLGHIKGPITAEQDFWYIIFLRRAHVGLIAGGIFTLFIGCIFTFSSNLCKRKFSGSLYGTAATAFLLSSLCIISSQVIFHTLLTAELLLRPKQLPTLYYTWSEALRRNSQMNYSFMYYFVWCAAGLAILACLFLVIALFLNNRLRAREPDSDTMSHTTDNRVPLNLFTNPGYTPQQQSTLQANGQPMFMDGAQNGTNRLSRQQMF